MMRRSKHMSRPVHGAFGRVAYLMVSSLTIRERPMHRDDKKRYQPNWTSALVLAFGLLALAFLVAIDRPGWWQIKPATGTAAAMSYAAEKPSKG
ncbi:hypothetical protein ACU5AX_11640 [Sphingomonas sp. XXL09]|uniref:hypothetical protein n=1 Tax=Sphingomonas sp. XXL09 TaxID=3457787 RepID=UPI00406BAEFC